MPCGGTARAARAHCASVPRALCRSAYRGRAWCPKLPTSAERGRDRGDCAEFSAPCTFRFFCVFVFEVSPFGTLLKEQILTASSARHCDMGE